MPQRGHRTRRACKKKKQEARLPPIELELVELETEEECLVGEGIKSLAQQEVVPDEELGTGD